MFKIALRILINAAALWVAARFIDGIMLTDKVSAILIVALIFGVVNALLRPLVMAITLPALILTLGLFTLVVNTAMLGATAWLSDNLSIDGFASAFWGALIITGVSWVLSSILINDNER